MYDDEMEWQVAALAAKDLSRTFELQRDALEPQASPPLPPPSTPPRSGVPPSSVKQCSPSRSAMVFQTPLAKAPVAEQLLTLSLPEKACRRCRLKTPDPRWVRTPSDSIPGRISGLEALWSAWSLNRVLTAEAQAAVLL